MAEELKTRSFRIDETTAEQFKNISQEIGGNQQQALSKLIECYELQKGKAILLDKKGEIETFENHMTSITNMFMTSLQDNKEMKDTVRAEFESLLKSKDALIMELQEQVRSGKEKLEQYTLSMQETKEELKKVTEKFTTLERESKKNQAKYDAMLLDKDRLNKALQDSQTLTKKKLEETQYSLKEIKVIQSKYTALKEQARNLQASLDKAIVDNERALLEQERKHNQEMAAITEKYISNLEEKVNPTNKKPLKKKIEPDHEEQTGKKIIK